VSRKPVDCFVAFDMPLVREQFISEKINLLDNEGAVENSHL
jgi:hypothetical protein